MPASWSFAAIASCCRTACGRRRFTSTTGASPRSAHRRGSATADRVIDAGDGRGHARTRRLRTSISTSRDAPTGKASRPRRARRRPAASPRWSTCRSTAFPRRRPSRRSTAKRRAAAGRCHVDVGFWGGVVPGNVGDLEPLARAGVLGFKCFLSPSGVDEFAARQRSRPARGDADRRATRPAAAGARGMAGAAASSRSDDGSAPLRDVADRRGRRPAEHAAIELLIDLAGDARRARAHRPSGLGRRAAGRSPTRARRGVHDHRRNLSALPDVLRRRDRRRRHGAASARRRSASAIIASGCGRRCATATIDLVATDHSPAPPALKHLDDGNFIAAWGGIASLQLGLAGGVDRRRRSAACRSSVSPSGCAAAPARLAGLDRTQRRDRDRVTTPISSSSIPIASSPSTRRASIIVMP